MADTMTARRKADVAVSRDCRLVHLGRLALAWTRAAESFESEYTIDQRRRRELMKARDAAEERLRVACLAALASDPGIGEEQP